MMLSDAQQAELEESFKPGSKPHTVMRALMVFAEHEGGTMMCRRVSRKELACACTRLSGDVYSDKTVANALTRLRAEGIIEFVQTKGKANGRGRYRLFPHEHYGDDRRTVRPEDARRQVVYCVSAVGGSPVAFSYDEDDACRLCEMLDGIQGGGGPRLVVTEVKLWEGR